MQKKSTWVFHSYPDESKKVNVQSLNIYIALATNFP